MQPELADNFIFRRSPALKPLRAHRWRSGATVFHTPGPQSVQGCTALLTGWTRSVRNTSNALAPGGLRERRRYESRITRDFGPVPSSMRTVSSQECHKPRSTCCEACDVAAQQSPTGEFATRVRGTHRLLQTQYAHKK